MFFLNPSQIQNMFIFLIATYTFVHTHRHTYNSVYFCSYVHVFTSDYLIMDSLSETDPYIKLILSQTSQTLDTELKGIEQKLTWKLFFWKLTSCQWKRKSGKYFYEAIKPLNNISDRPESLSPRMQCFSYMQLYLGRTNRSLIELKIYSVGGNPCLESKHS